MSVFGIVCEMNPLHSGHQYLLDSARRMGADRIVCVMSGTTVQRGEFAVLEPYTRAEALIRCGADLVLELPFPWCSGSAEGFAKAGIAILSRFCDTVLFGSECGDIETLRRGGELAADEPFRAAYRAALGEGAPAAETYYRMLREGGVGELSSNDLLGVEYIRAAKELGAPLRFLTVKRRGAAYGATDLREGEYPSAMSIRRLWASGLAEQSVAYLPKNAWAVYRKALAEGWDIDPVRSDTLWLSFFRLCREKVLEDIAGNEGGLANRIRTAALRAATADELFASVRTKRYTDTHIRRVMLYCLAGVRKDDFESLPCYTTLLGASTQGRALLFETRRTSDFLVVTKKADAPKETREYRLGERIESAYAALLRRPRSVAELYARAPYIESESVGSDLKNRT